MGTHAQGWADKVFSIARTILFTALALVLAAKLIMAAWTVLVVTAAVVLGVLAVLCGLRWWWSRSGSW
jgi:hypothetical protein